MLEGFLPLPEGSDSMSIAQVKLQTHVWLSGCEGTTAPFCRQNKGIALTKGETYPGRFPEALRFGQREFLL